MNLLFRLLHILIFSPRRSPVALYDVCRTPFRVWLTDLDLLRHMNNGKYFSLQDLGRTDYMIRLGIAKTLKNNGWYPVVAAETLQFKRSLHLFQKFDLTTQVLCWNEKYFILEQRFVRRTKNGDEVTAYGLIKARFLKVTGGTVTPAECLKAGHLPTESPPAPLHVLNWLKSAKEHQQLLFPS